MIALFAGVYPALNQVNAARSWYLDVSLPIDEALPFVPLAIVGYCLVYVGLGIAYLVVRDERDWARAAWSCLLGTAVALACFAALPVEMTLRPDLTGLDGPLLFLTNAYYAADQPYNCFPSLHVTYAVLAPLVAWRAGPVARWSLVAIALVVIPSVLLIKQHYVLDAAAGLVNGVLCWWVVRAASRRTTAARA